MEKIQALPEGRTIKSLHFLAIGNAPVAIALASDGSIWHSFVVMDRGGITFRYPSALGGEEIGSHPPGWIECGACMLPQRPLNDVSVNPPHAMSPSVKVIKPVTPQ